MSTPIEALDQHRLRERAALYRHRSPDFAAWASGYGVIRHNDSTQVRVHEMVELLAQREDAEPTAVLYRRLLAADIIANAAIWLVVHMTYARSVYLDGRDLTGADFKSDPEGHTGGSLNMVPGYLGYLTANALTGVTRSWLMGQGHCVAAIDALNVLVDNMNPAHAERYGISDEGLTRLVRDFYGYTVGADGRPVSPLGSHVNAHTAGGVIEGGYLGFAELQYVHMPLRGERLVAFLSDGAYEEQRGGDWVPRWWRTEDCGSVVPVMIANGRRIDQRTTMAQEGGVHWMRQNLRHHGFDPIDIDGRDPAAFAWAILECEGALEAAGHAVRDGALSYPVPMPYVIAEAPKGYGFPGAGTNRAHNLPLNGNPSRDAAARREFNSGARQVWVPVGELRQAVDELATHEAQARPRERDHPLARRTVRPPELPEPPWRSTRDACGPMEGFDAFFAAIVEANPQLRARVGNPDEIRSNRMNQTLDLLKHRVTAPEPGVAESVCGGVITALNEETVVCSALANKGGINLTVSYEAFAVKMLGAIRQELIFARHQKENGRAPGWLSIGVVATSHVWENGKNEQSHQDPTLAEALLGEMADMSRVLFPADWNSALATLEALYQSTGQIWTMVIPKHDVPATFTADEARELVRTGARRVREPDGEPEAVCLVAVGGYQLAAALRAADRLTEHGVPASVVYLLEPGRFRAGRDDWERKALASDEERARLFPTEAPRLFLTHTRPEPLLGAVRPLDLGPARTRGLGYVNRGGTLTVDGMLYANRCTWAHAVIAAAELAGREPETCLEPEELAAATGAGDPGAILASQ